MTKHKMLLELEVRYDLLLKKMHERHAEEIAHAERQLAAARERHAVAHTRKQLGAWRTEHEGKLSTLEKKNNF